MIKFLRSHPAPRTIVFFIIYTPEEKKSDEGTLSALDAYLRDGLQYEGGCGLSSISLLLFVEEAGLDVPSC